MKSTALLCCLVASVGIISIAESKSDELGKGTAAPKADASDNFIRKEAGQVRDDNGLKMKFVWCPPGVVTMENAEDITAPAAKKEKPPNDDEVVDPKEEP